MGGHWQYHYIYGDQKNEGRCAAFGSADIKFSTGPSLVRPRPSVRERGEKRNRGREREEAALTKYRCLPGMTMKMDRMISGEDMFLA